jgi:hypothetical protein
MNYINRSFVGWSVWRSIRLRNRRINKKCPKWKRNLVDNTMKRNDTLAMFDDISTIPNYQSYWINLI